MPELPTLKLISEVVYRILIICIIVSVLCCSVYV